MPIDAATVRNEQSKQAQERARQTAQDFSDVFGQPRTRTPAQKRVLAHLETCAGSDGNAYRFDGAKDGVALVAAGIHRDGAGSILKVIERNVEFAADFNKAKKPAPKTIR